MPCYHPQNAAQLRYGERIRLGTQADASNLVIPCGKCIGCRAAHAAQWGARCAHEASQHPCNRFVTLTYDDEHLPPNGFLAKRDLCLFLKRLRKQHEPNKLRFFAAGEYGETTGRPHYHLLLFGIRFTDEQLAAGSGQHKLYTSDTLDSIWGKGSGRIGRVTAASATYVAQYQVKGNLIPPPTADGECAPAPFLVMSRRPGIGATWYEKYADDLQHGYLVNGGRKAPIPTYYRRKTQLQNPERFYHLKHAQEDERAERPPTDPRRLRDGEIIHHARRNLRRSN